MNLLLKTISKHSAISSKMFPQLHNSSIRSKFISYKDGPAQNMFVDQRQIKIENNHYLMKIKSIGINRAETLHRQGKYPIKKEQEKYLGLEAAGEVYDINTKQKLFDGMALLSGGSYSQYATIPKTHIMKIPKNLDYNQGAAIPQAWLTAYQLLGLAQLKPGNNVVIYAGASGVGTAAIQICKALGYNAFAVVSTQQKAKLCLSLGCKSVVSYKTNQSWDQSLINFNSLTRFDAVLDCVGVSNIDRTINLLQIDGRWILYGLLSGVKAQFNFMKLMQKRIVLKTSLLKSRSKQYKDNLINKFSQEIIPKFQNNQVKPIIDRILKTNFDDASVFVEAHRIMEKNQNAGKIIIEFQ